MKQNILFLLSLCIVLFSCSDKDDPIKEVEKPPVENKDPFITLKKSNIDFTNEGGSEAILIESNVTWTAKSSASWCTVTPLSGDKSTTSISLSAPANKEYDTRSCTVTLEGGGLTKTITVNQGENLGLLITQDRYELSNEASTIKVEVKANVEFEVEINDEWITRVEARALTTSQIEFKIAKNETYGNRDGSITIKQKDGGMTSTITIFQSQEDALILSKKEFELTSEAQAVEVEIKTNIDYEIIIPEDAKDWVSHSKTRALRTETVVLDIAQNKDYDERTAKIVVKDKKTNLQETVTIKQAANTGLIVSESRYELSNDGGTFNVEVKANIDYKVTINDNWITQIETRGLTTTNLTFTAAKNASYSNREGTITISQTDGDLSSTITVYQSQENAIILSEKEVEVSDRSQTLNVIIKTNIDFDVTIKEDGKSWVSYTPTRGLRQETVSLNISENKTDRTRSTEVYIKDKLTSLQETLTINQIGKEPGVYYVENMGALGSMLNQTQKDTITTMIIKGEINKADFEVMKKQMPKLKYINLKEVKCEGDKIPDYAFGDWSIGIANKNISTIILPESIKIIGRGAFLKCSGLTGSLIIPDGLTTIEWEAFYGCSGFTGELILPDGLTEIERDAFYGCSGFTGNLILPDGLTKIGHSVFRSCSGFTGSLILPDGLTKIESGTFRGCTGFTGNLILPKKLAKIEWEAFDGCTGFTGDLILPDGLKELSGFNGCTGISGELIIPDGVHTIGYAAFSDCIGLTGELIIPDGVHTIGYAAFSNCIGLTGELILSKGLITIERDAFYGCSGFTGNLILPDGLTEIGEKAFSNCYGFTGNLILPDNIETIEQKAFYECSRFTGNLIIPDKVTTISNSAFQNCYRFSKLIIGNSTATINESAFQSCRGLTEVVLGNSLKTINEKAFYGCSNISEKIVFPKSLTSTRKESFFGCNKVKAFQFPHTTPLGYYKDMLPSNATVEVPSSAVSTYKSTNGWKEHTIVGY